MAPSRHAAVLSTLLALPSLIAAASWDCEKIPADKVRFNLLPLAGQVSILDMKSSPEMITNTTWNIDICNPLKESNKKERCPAGTHVCGVLHEHHTDQETDEDDEIHLYPIAGNYEMHNSRGLDPQSTRLKDSQSNSDKDKEGVRIALHGGKLPFDGKSGTPQMAIFEFICDKERTGREEFDEKAREVRVRAEDDRDDKEGDEKGDDKENDKSLKLISYGNEKQDGKDVGVLRLEWRTKHACETQDNDDSGDDGEPAKKGTHWGFFTWFIIILFLAVAAYLIFGSWLNYNRYGARGWDLLPHGDTIRDIPYLLKDWARRVLSTVQGGGSRGGYSAV